MKKPRARKPTARKSAARRSGGRKSCATKRVAKRTAAKKQSAIETRAVREAEIRERYETLKDSFTERSRRLFVANEAVAFGYGGIVAAARATGMAPSVIGNGIREVRAIEAGTAPSLPFTRSRRPGGGRKKATEKDPTLLPDLKALIEATTRGDPESSLLWTARSQRNIVAALRQQGHQTNKNMLE